MGLGVLVSAALVRTRPRPARAALHRAAVLLAVAFAGALLMPEPVARSGKARLTPQRPSVPASVRRPFLLASLGVISSWSVGGLFLSLGPLLSASLLHTTNHLVTGLAVFALAGAGAAAQLLFGRAAPWAGRGRRAPSRSPPACC